MRSAILIAASATAVLAAYACFAGPEPAPDTAMPPAAAPVSFAAPAAAAGAPITRASAMERRAAEAATLAANGPQMLREGRLQGWWRSGQAQCAALGIDDCQRWLRDALAAWPDARAAAIASRAIERLPAVKEAQARLVQDMDTPLSQRLQRLTALREATMGREEAQAWFGREKAQVGFSAAVNEFAAGEAAGMSLAARLARVEDLRGQHYGAFYDDLRAAEGPMGQYRIELGLVRLDATDAQAADQLRDRLLARHFPRERAQEIAQLEKRSEQQQAQRSAYANELAALQRQYPNAADQDYLARLGQLRQKHFH
ncbi:lipase secretion chaperone [Massilia sp. DJPM01]|uniref:lipase secretion chaperone n=1 Tax=Massilia sp. DJPM01 TaxID=3024404 RepID=UPI00259FCDDF|nr:lipase secretion chaperone [Massilia sp. DJPM01]MDM5176124.1 lipase secretion chaperone [Massilia sp. DJPM01]